jgi:hypothetical protein
VSAESARAHGAEYRDAHDRAGEQEETRPPPIGDVAEGQLRHRGRQLEAHRQRTGRGERQAEARDQQRQQRREDVRVAVHGEVRGGHEQDGGVEPDDH